MESSRNDLGELAADAALERTDFLVQATDQFQAFIKRNADRIRDVGGLTLIDEDPDYLAIAPDLTFRSRSRYLDDATGEWVSETEVIETAAELIELYNPADLYTAFAEAAREAAGLEVEPTGASDLLETAHVPAADSFSLDDPYVGAADSWAAAHDDSPPTDLQDAAHRLYELALAFQDRSQRAEARLFEQFEAEAEALTAVLGDFVVVDDEDERLTLGHTGTFHGEVIPDDETGEWRPLASADDLVEFYDPTDVFGDLADALAEAFPGIAPEVEGAEESDGAGEAEDGEDHEDHEDVDPDQGGPDAKGPRSSDRG